MTTTAAAENLGGRAVVEKKDEKTEKRRALGRGLASLLPGPRVVEQASGVSHQPSAVNAVPADNGGSAATGVSAPHEPGPSAAFAAGQPMAAVPTYSREN